MRNYRKLFSFARPYYGLFILSILFMGIVALLDLFRLSAIVPVMDRIFTKQPIIFTKGKLPVFIENILNQLNNLAPLRVLCLIVIIVPIVLVVRAIFEFIYTYLMSGVGQKVVRNVRNLIYEKLQTLSLDYFTRQRSGELVSRITNDVRLIENAVSYALTDLAYQSYEVVAYALLVFWLIWKFSLTWTFALISIVLLPLVAIPIVTVGKVLRKLSRKSQEKMADINSLLFETFTGVRIVRAFCMEKKEIQKFKGQNQDYYKIAMKSIKRMLILGIGTELIGMMAAVFIIFQGGKLVIESRLSSGIFILFMAAILSLIRPFKKLSQVNSIMQQAMAASERIWEVLETKPTVVEKFPADEIKGFKKSIVFDNVWFNYADQEILKGINLEVKYGELLAIVGPSGVGKTTLVDLIPRFYDPKRGRILIDDIDIKEVTLKSLRQQIGVVTQETILFNDTIRANIAYGRPQAWQEEIEQAATQAYAHDFIRHLLLGYDTVIGDRGTKLSGGERQRIAIARALLKNPPILILDEATSQLDSESESIVQGALDRLVHGRTVFVIAHRLSTVRHAQRIIVLDEGRIVEQGSHHELINQDGLYKRLYQLQELQN